MSTEYPGRWRVMHNYAGGETFIRVYRVRNTAEVVHAGNVEFYPGTFATDEEAQAVADRLNAGGEVP